MLTTGQLGEAIGRNYKTASRNLVPLRRKGLIDYGRLYDLEAARDSTAPIAPKKVYALTPAGVRRCRADGLIDDDMLTFPREWGGRALSDRSYFHHLGVVDVQLALWRSIQRHDSYRLESMIPDFIQIGTGTERKRATTDNIKPGETIVPDCVALLRNRETGAARTLFIEYERKSRCPEEVKKKLANYAAYLKRKSRKHSEGAPLVCYIVTDEYRIPTVRAHAEADALSSLIAFATVADIKRDFLGRVWVAHDGGLWSPIGAAE